MHSIVTALPGFSFLRIQAPGLLFAALLAALAALLAQWGPLAQLGLSAMTLAIALGMLVGNTVFPRLSSRTGAGVDLARSMLLRAGIVLYGFRISLHDIGAVGWPGLLIAVAMVALTFSLALWVGTRWLGLDRQTAALIGAGSAICGAAAVMATQPVVRGEEHKVSIAVATVVVFGTLSMLLYPLLYPYMGLSEHAFGLFAGSTIHEVAQVVAVGQTIGTAAANGAVVEKMLRVMMLAPFLMWLSFRSASDNKEATGLKACWKQVRIPWFAVLFILTSAVHSLGVIPSDLIARFVQLDTLLLSTAMAAMGLRTSAASLRRAGVQPLKLGALLFIFLMGGGYLVNAAVFLMF
ncbi:YeiH family protein [Variovorax sp. J2P1-59]|uniref:YeiH family protein n=1 Tax=Variovorax flavidus TaxID=3053501 RepID=UPI002578856E|nr:YeiH family protein [Variovorax sp. J2P1-59]MDM0078531.1 YeiH family protein [Variovorax sp. J2P1-59]